MIKEIPKTAGDYHKWAEVWAIESVHSAASAYRGITFGTAEFDSDHRLTRINILYLLDMPTAISLEPLDSYRELVCDWLNFLTAFIGQSARNKVKS